MTDERFVAAFQTFDTPVEPDAAFADRLFDDLVADLGLRRRVARAGGLGPTLAGRILRALGIERLPVGPQAMRVAWLVALVGLLILAVAGALLVASLLRPRPSPLDLVQLSREAYAAAPAIRMTIHDEQGDSVVSGDGHGTWRSETWSDTPGSYALYDGTRVGYYDATTRTWQISPVENGGPSFPFNSEFAWTKVDFPGLKATLSDVPCMDATDPGELTIAGRTAAHIACPGIRMEYWTDAATHIVLRTVAHPDSPYGITGGDQDVVREVTSFEEIPAPDAADFAWTGPVEARSPDDPLASSVLVVGQRPPAWQGRTLDGQVIGRDGLRGPAALLFFSPSCGRCARPFEDLSAVAPGIDGLTSIAVGSDETGDGSFLAGFVEQHPTAIPVVKDTGAIAQSWGITVRPAIVLLAADGTVAGMSAAIVSRDDLAAMLEAVAAGRAIPSVEPLPSPTPTPGDPSLDPSVECGGDLVTCLPIGSRLPVWSAPLLSGGTFESASAAGRPLVLWFQGIHCDGTCPDWYIDEFRAFEALAARYGDRATVLMLSDTQATRADTTTMLGTAEADFPVAFDTDGSLANRFQMIVMGVIVADGDGRLVGQAEKPSDANVQPLVDQLLADAAPTLAPAASP